MRAATVTAIPPTPHLPHPAVEALAPASPAPEQAPSPRELSIVEQIDAILQKYIAADPRLARRSIHLEHAPNGGLRITVDNNYYQRPAEIEEKEVQLVIKMALKEWESS